MISFKEGNRVELTNMPDTGIQEWDLIAGAAALAGYGIISGKDREQKLLRLFDTADDIVYTPYKEEMAEWIRILSGKEQVKIHPRADEAARKAEKAFGTTDRMPLAGYIDTNGKFLRFSYQGYMRDMDHREIRDVFDDMALSYGDSNSKALILFMDMGNIRLYGNGGADISTCPNERQWAPLKRYLNYFGKVSYVDLSARKNGLHIATLEYPAYGTWSLKDDITRFFRTGLLPENTV